MEWSFWTNRLIRVGVQRSHEGLLKKLTSFKFCILDHVNRLEVPSVDGYKLWISLWVMVQVPLYIAAQCGGSIMASFALRWILHPVASEGATLPAGSEVQSFLLEIVITFILMFVVAAVATDTRAVRTLTSSSQELTSRLLRNGKRVNGQCPDGSTMEDWYVYTHHIYSSGKSISIQELFPFSGNSLKVTFLCIHFALDWSISLSFSQRTGSSIIWLGYHKCSGCVSDITRHPHVGAVWWTGWNCCWICCSIKCSHGRVRHLLTFPLRVLQSGFLGTFSTCCKANMCIQHIKNSI